MPTSILLGLGAAPLWSAQGSYLTSLGHAHADKTGRLSKDVVNQYFGLFFLIFQSSGVWGNLISSLVLGQTPTRGKGKAGRERATERPAHSRGKVLSTGREPGSSLVRALLVPGQREGLESIWPQTRQGLLGREVETPPGMGCPGRPPPSAWPSSPPSG